MSPPPPIADCLRAALAARLEPRRGAGLVLAVSGGADSVALLRLLHELAPDLGLALIVAHLNHGARGEQSDADAAFVAALAESLGLPCEVGRWTPERPAHFEADARRARYAWLAAVADRHRADMVAVAHTREDQAETILHRILRGTGLHGLAGMPASRELAPGVTLIRPLLDQSRADLRAYLDALGQPHREDPSNADTSRTRARLRHELIPRLEADYNPRVVEAVVSLGVLAGASREALRRRLDRVVDAVAWDPETDTATLAVPRLATLPPTLRVEALRLAWRRLGWPERDMTRAHWERLARATSRRYAGPARFHLPGPVLVEREGEEVRWRREATPAPPLAPPPAPVAVPIPGSARWGDRVLALAFDPDPTAAERLDADALAPFRTPEGEAYLCLCAPAPGDRFAPLGMDGRTTPLADFLRGRGLDAAARRMVPLLCDERGIVWVVGHRIAERVRRTEATRRVLGLRFDPDG
jgi:tRNA(Ile)-lysidine synthase